MEFRKEPRIDRRTKQQVGWRWIFYQYNPDKKRNDKVPKAAIPPHIWNSLDEDEVRLYCASQAAIQDAIRDRAKRRLDWQNKYHDFSDLLDKFVEHHKKAAPNSWQNDVHYLRNYVFSFFLVEKAANNINHWPLLYADFKSWLEKTKPLKKSISKLSLNTQNKAINALNRFIDFLSTSHRIEALRPMELHRRDRLPEVTIEELFEESEIDLICNALLEIRPLSAKIFMILIGTGLRINEALGLCLKFIFAGKIEGGKTSDKIHNSLSKYGLEKYHGYICLESQPACDEIRVKQLFVDRDGVRWPTGSVPRKPLKCRKKIDPKNNRLIPVFSKSAWNLIVDAWNEQIELYEQRIHGIEERDYLLFEGVTASMFYLDMMKAFEVTGLESRSPHKCRHTFLTWFYGETLEDMFLAEWIGGHRDKRSLEVYSHMREQLGREQQFKDQGLRKMSRV